MVPGATGPHPLLLEPWLSGGVLLVQLLMQNGCLQAGVWDWGHVDVSTNPAALIVITGVLSDRRSQGHGACGLEPSQGGCRHLT